MTSSVILIWNSSHSIDEEPCSVGSQCHTVRFVCIFARFSNAVLSFIFLALDFVH